MKKFVTLAFITAGLSLAACNGPIPAYQDPNMPMQVSVTDYWLQNQVRVTVLPPQRVGAGQLKVPIQVMNTTDHDLSLDYQYWFVDKGGAQVDNQPSWEFVKIPPKGYTQIDPTSISASAADFRVQIRPAK